MSRSESIISNLNENKKVCATNCPWHFQKGCFLLKNNENQREFHCLYIRSSNYWISYSVSESCDIPEQYSDLIQLRRKLGVEYVLPFADHIRERSGYTIGKFELRVGLHSSNIIEPKSLAEVFYTLIVLLCATCKQFGGHPPILKLMTFLYTKTHPVLCDVGSKNVEKRVRIGHRPFMKQKSWLRFLNNRTSLEVYRYLKLIRPDLFKKKCNGICLLNENVSFNDATHSLICKSKKQNLITILKDYMFLLPDDTVADVIQTWILDVEQHNLLIQLSKLKNGTRSNVI